jgi:hypothetical protein
MFLAPLFLLGLIAIGAPLWLHRVARANPVQHAFPSLMLLEASETQRTAKRTLRYWLLLLARIALLLAVVLAFAGPVWKKQTALPIAVETTLHAILIDASLSMQRGQQWERALATAQEVLETVRSPDQVMVVRAAGRRMDVIQEPVSARDAGAVRAALLSLQPGIERLDFGYAMNTAEQWLRKPRPPVVLHVISDFQLSGAPLRFADLEPPSGSRLVMHDVAARDAANVWIEAATLSATDARTINVTVASTAGATLRRTVVLSIDGTEYARKTTTLPQFGATPLEQIVAGEGGITQRTFLDEPHEHDEHELPRVEITFDDVQFTPGAHRIAVHLEPNDALPQDDRFFAVVEHANPKALLLTRSDEADDAAYFGAAVSALTAPAIEVTRQPAASFELGELSHAALLVVPDVFALSSSAAQRIHQYVESGGALLTTLGASAADGAVPLLDDWQVRAPRARLVPIGEIDASHPILRDAQQWRAVRFFRQREVRVADTDRVLIAHADGAPLLVEREIGAGRMLVLTAPIDRAWNDLAIHPTFVQFISQAARYLIGNDTATASVTVGAAVPTGLTAAAGGQIFDPTGARVLELGATRSVERLLPTQLGFYEVRHPTGARWIAVNTDRRESVFAPLGADYLARWQALRARESAVQANTMTTAMPTATHSLGPMLMWIAALLAIAELLFANRYLMVRRESAK